MDVLYPNQKSQLLDFIATNKFDFKQWLLVEIYRTQGASEEVSALYVSGLISDLFRDYEGRILICNKDEILVLIRWGQRREPKMVGEEIIRHLPPGSYEVTVHPELAAGIQKLRLKLAPPSNEIGSPMFRARAKREENIVLVADDDMYMRALMKRGLAEVGEIVEAANGNGIEELYQKINPDIVYLDIHLPGEDGRSILHNLLAIDPDAFVVMVSADSSLENVQGTSSEGAKGFLAKPFTKERLLEFVRKCVTIVIR